MRYLCGVVLVVCLVLLANGLPAFAQESMIGVGIEAENMSFTMVSFGPDGADAMFDNEMFFEMRTLSTTPAFLISIRPNPNIFIEPRIGFHTSNVEQSDSIYYYYPINGLRTDEATFRDLNLGIGFIFSISPSNFVSPYVHAKFDIHFLHGEVKYADTFSNPNLNNSETDEISAKAFAVSLGLGGMVNIKDQVFLTLEGRFQYARMGDPERKRSWSPPSSYKWEDTTETKTSAIGFDMVLGLRVFF